MSSPYHAPRRPQSPSRDQPTPLAIRPRTAARMLGVSERTLWSMTKRGEIPHARVGRGVLYPWAELVRWLEDKTLHPPVKRPAQAERGDA